MTVEPGAMPAKQILNSARDDRPREVCKGGWALSRFETGNRDTFRMPTLPWRLTFCALLAFDLASSMAIPGRAEPSPSGVTMPRGDIPGWRQVFADNFTTDVPVGSFPNAVSDNWSAYEDGWKTTFKNGLQMPSRVVSVHDGVMDLHLHTENGIRLVAAVLPKIRGAVDKEGGLLEGRYAIRFKADPLPCYGTAWLLWPDSETWPRDGEIDFPEGPLDGAIGGYVHHQDAAVGGDQDAFATAAKYTTWHTAVIERTLEKVTFYLDGKEVGETSNRVPETPMHWVIQNETAKPSCVPSGSEDGHIYIAWVVAYKRP